LGNLFNKKSIAVAVPGRNKKNKKTATGIVAVLAKKYKKYFSD
jgi:hypothetical protein